MTEPPVSPYQLVLGTGLVGLHPRLREYFTGIPSGNVGIGRGVFDLVGTPRRWLWPVLWVLRRQKVLFPVWAQNVPFTVVNCPQSSPSARPTVSAVRTFHFGTGDRSMVDEITAGPDGLVDDLGARKRYRVALSATVDDGALVMSSTSLRVRIGRRSLPIPKLVAPRVALVERFDDATDLQRVAVTVDLPLIGRLFYYAGAFRYEIKPSNWGQA